MADDKNEKKLIIDEDWKKQAQQEKERLAAEATGKEPAKVEEAADLEEAPDRGPLPPGNFQALVSMLATQAYMAMGAIRGPQEKEFEPDLEFARYNIDILGTLEEKTKGNLSEDEGEMLHQALHSLRMLYVKLAQ